MASFNANANANDQNEEVKNLVGSMKTACDMLQPLIFIFYSAISSGGTSGTSKLKADKSFFTIADGLVQYMLVNFLFGEEKFAAIVGEEDSSTVHFLTSAEVYKVDDLIIPDEFRQLVDFTAESIRQLGLSIHPTAFKSYTVFIDPIDGTREFSSGLGEQCSVCIGLADEKGKAIAGIVYRPITSPPTYAIGALSATGAHYTESRLESVVSPPRRGLLTSNGGISPFIKELMTQLQCERVPSGGAGNKMLMLLEGKGDCYIQDRGVSRWDTCAAEAVLEAHGGVLAKLSSFVSSQQLETYHYLKTAENLDFVEKLASLTPYNASPAAKDRGLLTKAGVTDGADITVQDFNPYSNLCGLFAVMKTDPEVLNSFHSAITAAAAVSAPAYD